MTTDNRRVVALLPEIVTQTVSGRSLPEMVAAHRDWLAANALTAIPVPEASLEARSWPACKPLSTAMSSAGCTCGFPARLRETGPARRTRFAAPFTLMAGAEEFELSLLLFLVAVGVYSIVSGGHLIGGPKLFGAGHDLLRVLRPVSTRARGRRDSFLGCALAFEA